MRFAALREECHAANLGLPDSGLVDLTFGNVSVLDPDAGVFAIKPSGVAYAALKPEDMVVLDLEGQQIEGKRKPSSDTPTHRRLFRVFTGIRSVVHTHSRTAVAFAQAGSAIPCLGTTHADYFHGPIPVTRPLRPDEIGGEYEWETGAVIEETFCKRDPLRMSAVLVHGHGPFVWGPSGAKAVENAQVLEIVAEMAWKSFQINPEAVPISEALLNKHHWRKHGPQAYYGQ